MGKGETEKKTGVLCRQKETAEQSEPVKTLSAKQLGERYGGSRFKSVADMVFFNMKNECCPLCQSGAPLFSKDKKRLFYICGNCRGIFLSEKDRPGPDQELARYRSHHNNVDDTGYQEFVAPIVQSVYRDFTGEHRGLDFGAGTGPVISKLLTESGYKISLYDPFFHNNPERLKKKYDYIVCCEVIEHFHKPEKEFQLLQSRLTPGGKLYCMTNIYNPRIDFKSWYYKNDKTHVFFYQVETLTYIKNRFRFSEMEISDNLITFTRGNL